MKAALFFVIFSVAGMTLTENLMAADYVPVLVFGSKYSRQFKYPYGIAIDSSGNIFVADGNNRIQKFDSAGKYLNQFGSPGSGNGQFSNPQGIAVDSSGNIFVTDRSNHRIQKFSSTGVYLSQFGSYGSGNGQFQYPYGIAVDSSGNIFVADTVNNRIQKFDNAGVYQSQFGTLGTGDGQFKYPYGIAIDSSGNIFVVDRDNNRVQKFDSMGGYQSQFGTSGLNGNGQFTNPNAIAIDTSGNIFVVDHCLVQKFDSAGVYQSQFGRLGAGDGQFDFPEGIAVDSSGNIFMADTNNHRIQKLGNSGVYQSQFGTDGSVNGQFINPNDIAIDTSGNIFVADSGIQKFNSAGVYQSRFGSYGSLAIDSSGNIFVANSGMGIHLIHKFDSAGVWQSQFDFGDRNVAWPEKVAVAVESSGNIFVSWVYCIQKFDNAGVYQSQFGSNGTGNGQFSDPQGLAIDSSGNIFVTDRSNHRIQKFNNAGVYQSQFGSNGTGNGQFNYPCRLAIDSSGNIFVSDTGNNRIQKFDSAGVYQSQFGSNGSGNGQFSNPNGIAVDSSGNIFVVDSGNGRIQKWADVSPKLISGYIRDSSNNPGIGITLTFSNNGGTAITNSSGFYTKTVASGWSGTVTPSKGSYNFTPMSLSYSNISSDMPAQNYAFVASNKAIIVAGGGNYAANSLWDATKLNTDYAYSALRFQGYNPENIYYLSADSNIMSPVKGFASKENFRNAILTWASDAGNLLIYMADHGGYGTFRMNESEILLASELDGWLDSLQQTIPGYVILIYDACQSGSFIGLLIPPTGKKRIVAASASTGENAIFASEGTLSFSWLFWSQIYSGLSFYPTLLNAQSSMSFINPQNSVIEADGNGIGNEDADKEIARNIILGDGKVYGADFPVIGSVSPPQILTDKTSALIYAENITDADGIKKVWAVITPPQNTGCISADTPVTSLPVTELYKVSDKRYEGIYNGFFVKGTYKIAVFATDINDFTSMSAEKNITLVTQTQNNTKKGDITGDSQVNLSDVISALQILSGLKPSQSRCDYGTSGADVNGDNRVGLQEVVYILQVVSGLR